MTQIVMKLAGVLFNKYETVGKGIINKSDRFSLLRVIFCQSEKE
ncbi:hypothetical protein [Waterburya agarophytonicola]|nr:hypothetical protein [Waterburya agarophytonicola]